MRKIFILLTCLFTFIVSACVYHPDVQQGNVITEKDLRALHEGMSTEEVRALLGEPLLVNVFTDNRLVYVYTYQKGHHKMTSTRLLVYVRDDHVVRYWTDFYNPKEKVTLPSP